MTESTTETETEPVALDKADLDTERTDAEAGDRDNVEATSEETDASTAGSTKRKRGRRGRRAAAAVAGDEAAGDEAAPGKSDKRPKVKKDSKGGKASEAGAAATGRPLLDGRRLTRVITGLLVLAVLLGATVIVLAIKGPGNAGKLEAREDRSEDARQKADELVPKLYSFDYRQIDANINEQGQLTVGDIHDQIQSDTGPALKALAPKIKAVVQAVSVGSAVVDDSGQDVQVLVYLNQATSSNLLPAPRLDRNRLVVTMRLVNGQWKVAGIKAL